MIIVSLYHKDKGVMGPVIAHDMESATLDFARLLKDPNCPLDSLIREDLDLILLGRVTDCYEILNVGGDIRNGLYDKRLKAIDDYIKSNTPSRNVSNDTEPNSDTASEVHNG